MISPCEITGKPTLQIVRNQVVEVNPEEVIEKFCILKMNLNYFTYTNTDKAWHGSCLFCALFHNGSATGKQKCLAMVLDISWFPRSSNTPGSCLKCSQQPTGQHLVMVVYVWRRSERHLRPKER